MLRRHTEFKKANFPLPREDLLAAANRPVVARATDCPAGFQVEAHTHNRSQLAFSPRGSITVRTDHGLWVVPSHRAVWIPAGVRHQIESPAKVSMWSIFVDPASSHELSDACGLLPISTFVRELIFEAIKLPYDYKLGGPDERIMLVLLDQLRTLAIEKIQLPMPQDRRLLKVAHAILENPADKRQLSEWAAEAGAGERTLSRLFPLETGMQFRAWQQQARLLEALRLLSAGNSVTTVAMDVGYDSISAFIGMFKRALGKTPGEFFRH